MNTMIGIESESSVKANQTAPGSVDHDCDRSVAGRRGRRAIRAPIGRVGRGGSIVQDNPFASIIPRGRGSRRGRGACLVRGTSGGSVGKGGRGSCGGRGGLSSRGGRGGLSARGGRGSRGSRGICRGRSSRGGNASQNGSVSGGGHGGLSARCGRGGLSGRGGRGVHDLSHGSKTIQIIEKSENTNELHDDDGCVASTSKGASAMAMPEVRSLKTVGNANVDPLLEIDQIAAIKLKRPRGRPRKIPLPLPQAKATTIEEPSGTLYETCPNTKTKSIVLLTCRLCDKERSGKYYSLFAESADESKTESFGNGTEQQVLVTSSSLIFKKKQRTECIDMKNILKVMNRLNLEIKKDDGMPQNICELCAKRIFVLYSFVRRGLQIQQDVRQKLNKPPLGACQAISPVAIKAGNSFISSSVEPACSVIENSDNSPIGLNDARELTSTLPLPLVTKEATKAFSPIVIGNLSLNLNHQVLQQASVKRKRGRPAKKKRNNNKQACGTNDNKILQFCNGSSVPAAIKPKRKYTRRCGNIVNTNFAKGHYLRNHNTKTCCKDSDDKSETQDVIAEARMQMEYADESETTTLNLHGGPSTSLNAVKRKRVYKRKYVDNSEEICEKKLNLGRLHTDEIKDEKNYEAKSVEIIETVNSNLLIEEPSKNHPHEQQKYIKRKTKDAGEQTSKKKLCFEEQTSGVDRQHNSTTPSIVEDYGEVHKELNEIQQEKLKDQELKTTDGFESIKVDTICLKSPKISHIVKAPRRESLMQLENMKLERTLDDKSSTIVKTQVQSPNKTLMVEENQIIDDLQSKIVKVLKSKNMVEKVQQEPVKYQERKTTADLETTEDFKISSRLPENEFGEEDKNKYSSQRNNKETLLFTKLSKQVQQEQLKDQELKTSDDFESIKADTIYLKSPKISHMAKAPGRESLMQLENKKLKKTLDDESTIFVKTQVQSQNKTLMVKENQIIDSDIVKELKSKNMVEKVQQKLVKDQQRKSISDLETTEVDQICLKSEYKVQIISVKGSQNNIENQELESTHDIEASKVVKMSFESSVDMGEEENKKLEKTYSDKINDIITIQKTSQKQNEKKGRDFSDPYIFKELKFKNVIKKAKQEPTKDQELKRIFEFKANEICTTTSNWSNKEQNSIGKMEPESTRNFKRTEVFEKSLGFMSNFLKKEKDACDQAKIELFNKNDLNLVKNEEQLQQEQLKDQELKSSDYFGVTHLDAILLKSPKSLEICEVPETVPQEQLKEHEKNREIEATMRNIIGFSSAGNSVFLKEQETSEQIISPINNNDNSFLMERSFQSPMSSSNSSTTAVIRKKSADGVEFPTTFSDSLDLNQLSVGERQILKTNNVSPVVFLNNENVNNKLDTETSGSSKMCLLENTKSDNIDQSMNSVSNDTKLANSKISEESTPQQQCSLSTDSESNLNFPDFNYIIGEQDISTSDDYSLESCNISPETISLLSNTSPSYNTSDYELQHILAKRPNKCSAIDDNGTLNGVPFSGNCPKCDDKDQIFLQLDSWYLNKEEEVATTRAYTILEKRESVEKEMLHQAVSKSQEHEETTLQLLQSAAISDDLKKYQELNTPNTVESAGDKNVFRFIDSFSISKELATEKEPQKLLETTKAGRTDETLQSLNNIHIFKDLKAQELYDSLDNFQFLEDVVDQVEQQKEEKTTAAGRNYEPFLSFENSELQVHKESQQIQEFNVSKIEKTEEVLHASGTFVNSQFLFDSKKANTQCCKEPEKSLHIQQQIHQQPLLYTEPDKQEKHQVVPKTIYCKDINDHNAKELDQLKMLIQSLDTQKNFLEKSVPPLEQNVLQATHCPKSTQQEKQYTILDTTLFPQIDASVVSRPEEEDMFIQSFDQSLFNEELENRDQQEQQKTNQNSLYLNEQQQQTEYNSPLSIVEDANSSCIPDINVQFSSSDKQTTPPNYMQTLDIVDNARLNLGVGLNSHSGRSVHDALHSEMIEILPDMAQELQQSQQSSLVVLPPPEISPIAPNDTADYTTSNIYTKTPHILPALKTAIKSDDDAQSPGVSSNISMRSLSSSSTDIDSPCGSDSPHCRELTKYEPVSLHCRFCHKRPKFTNNLDYSRHVIEMHPEGAPFNCPHCPLRFVKRLKRQQHVIKEHATRRFPCARCNQRFQTQHSLDLHLQRVHAVEILNALKTQRMTQNQEAHKKQTNTANSGTAATGENRLSISSTQQFSTYLREMKSPPMRRIIDSPNDATEPNALLLCRPNCSDLHDPRMYSEAQHAQHCHRVQSIENVTDQRAVASPQTEPDSTTSTTTLRQFRRRRTPPKAINSTCTLSFPSSLLSTTFTTSQASLTDATVQQQQQFTTGEMTRGSHECLICKKRYMNAKALRKHHQTAHINQHEMPFVCSICGRGFRMRASLNRHMETHDAAGRPYECDQCQVRFPRLSQLSVHRNSVHTKRTFMCEKCGEQLSTERALREHIGSHKALV